MTISATIVADSISPTGVRITTFSLEYPRYIHSELMTHRVFSRNASSSRAIPVNKMLERVTNDPVVPISWGKNQRGMQSKEELSGEIIDKLHDLWLIDARIPVVKAVEKMMELGLHKQVANRLLEPWSNISVVVTSTEWANWYALRHHEDAQPEIQRLAEEMLKAHNNSNPKLLKYYEWHLPFSPADGTIPTENDIKSSVARCARVSYKNHLNQTPSLEEDLQLYDRLVLHNPIHASPTEHQATPLLPKRNWPKFWTKSEQWSGNFRGWLQYRKTLPFENVLEYPLLEVR